MIKQLALVVILVALMTGYAVGQAFPQIQTDGQLFIDWKGLLITDSQFQQLMIKFQNTYDDTNQLLGLHMEIGGNQITNLDPLLKLIIYDKMSFLQIRAQNQVKKISRLNQLTFLRTMNLETFSIDLSENALTDLVFLTPALTLNKLKNILINMNGNQLPDSAAFSRLTQMTALEKLELRLQNNFITNHTSLNTLQNLAYLKDIILAVEFYQAQNNYSFIAQYNSAPALEYFQTLIGSCSLLGNYLQLNLSDTSTYQCLPCYDICLRCFGSAYNQCLSCRNNSKFVYNPTTHTCDYRVPQPIDGFLTLNFERSGITNYIFQLFMQQFQRSYQPNDIRGLDLNLVRNNITNLTEIYRLTPYDQIKNLTIRFDSQAPEIDTMYSNWDFTANMKLNSLYISMQNNDVDSLTFLGPIFQVQHDLISMQLDFIGNLISDLSACSLMTNLRSLKYLDITLDGPIKGFDPLSSIGQLQNLERLRVYILEQNSSIPVLFNWVSNFNNLMNLSMVQIFTPAQFSCNLNDNHYIAISEDAKSLSCMSCYLYCRKCFGPAENQCLSCLGNKFIYNPTNHTCDLQLPPILPGGIVIIDFDSMLITTPVLIQLMVQFRQKYPIDAINALKMDFRYNKIDNYDSFGQLAEYQNISLMDFDLSSQTQSTFKMNYNYSKQYNYIMNLSEYEVDGRECKMYNSYITVLRGGQDWACNPCGYQCAKCYGPSINNCLSCIDNYRLVYDPVNHTCHFTFPDIEDGMLIIDICKLKITNDQLISYIDQVLMHYQSELHTVTRLVFLSMCGSLITDYSALGNLTYFGQVQLLELQLQSPTKQFDYTFLKNYNYLTALNYFEGNMQSCSMNHTYIRVSPDKKSWSCDSCATHCSKCFGSQSNECLACDSGCTYQPDTHSCSCKSTEEEYFIEHKLRSKI